MGGDNAGFARPTTRFRAASGAETLAQKTDIQRHRRLSGSISRRQRGLDREKSLPRAVATRLRVREIAREDLMEVAMKKAIAVARPMRSPMLDLAFAGGSTAVFLVLLASVAGAISIYLR
jgi:hypothetical protein